MKPSSLFFTLLASAASAQTSSGNIHHTLWPTLNPDSTTDPYYCYTEDITHYFSPPEPTGALSSAFSSFDSRLYDDCTFTGAQRLECPFPDQSRWCLFGSSTSVPGQPAPVPTSMLPAYSSFGSLASSWWAANSASALSLAQHCTFLWANEAFILGRHLNKTIAIANCYAEAVKSNGGVVPPMTTAAAPGSVPTAGGARPTNAAVLGIRANVERAIWGGFAAAAVANVPWY